MHACACMASTAARSWSRRRSALAHSRVYACSCAGVRARLPWRRMVNSFSPGPGDPVGPGPGLRLVVGMSTPSAVAVTTHFISPDRISPGGVIGVAERVLAAAREPGAAHADTKPRRGTAQLPWRTWVLAPGDHPPGIKMETLFSRSPCRGLPGGRRPGRFAEPVGASVTAAAARRGRGHHRYLPPGALTNRATRTSVARPRILTHGRSGTPGADQLSRLGATASTRTASA